MDRPMSATHGGGDQRGGDLFSVPGGSRARPHSAAGRRPLLDSASTSSADTDTMLADFEGRSSLRQLRRGSSASSHEEGPLSASIQQVVAERLREEFRRHCSQGGTSVSIAAVHRVLRALGESIPKGRVVAYVYLFWPQPSMCRIRVTLSAEVTYSHPIFI